MYRLGAEVWGAGVHVLGICSSWQGQRRWRSAADTAMLPLLPLPLPAGGCPMNGATDCKGADHSVGWTGARAAMGAAMQGF